MLNHCYNQIEIKGDPQEIEKFRSECFDGDEFDFNSIVPQPECLEGTCSPNNAPEIEKVRIREQTGGWDNWYDWCNDNWGTKWGAYDGWICHHNNPDDFTFGFNTAWSPANTSFYDIMIQKYPMLEITYYFYEPGSAFAGSYSQDDFGTINENCFYYGEADYKRIACEVFEGWDDFEEEDVEEIVDVLDTVVLPKAPGSEDSLTFHISDLGKSTLDLKNDEILEKDVDSNS